jgi:hypothetical protein
VHLFTALSWALLVLDALAGLVILHRRWHRATWRTIRVVPGHRFPD